MQNYLKDYLQNFRFHFVCLKRQICLINQRVRERNSPWSHFNKQQDSSPFNSPFHKGFVFVPYSLRIICIRWLATDEITALNIKDCACTWNQITNSHMVGWIVNKIYIRKVYIKKQVFSSCIQFVIIRFLITNVTEFRQKEFPFLVSNSKSFPKP